MPIVEQPDVSVVVFAEDEANALRGCVHSVRRAAGHARRNGWTVELSMVLRNPTARTLAWIGHALDPDWAICHATGPSLGAARNMGCRHGTGRHVAIIDGTDLWSETWLTAALTTAEQAGTPAVWRPEILVTFGKDYFSDAGYATLLQSELPDSGRDCLLDWNPYPSGFLAPRSIIEAVPFPLEDPERGWAEIDWWWNCNLVGAGHVHRVVPGTFHYRRVGSGAVPLAAPQDPARHRIGPTSLAWQPPAGMR